MGFPFDADGSQDKDSGPRGIPEGDYEFRVHETPIHSITSTNRNMLTMKLVVEDGEYSGKSIKFNLVFLTKDHASHSMTIKALKAFGLEYDGVLNVEPSDFQDKLVRAHVRVKAEKFIPKGETEIRVVNKSEIGWFLTEDDQFTPPTPAGRKSATTQPAPKVRDEDEVPF